MGSFNSHSRVKGLLRRGSYDILVKMHEQGMDVLQEFYDLVHDNDIKVRAHIAHALLWLVQRDANLIDSFTRIIIQLLDDEEPFVRARACDAFDVIVGEYCDEEKHVIPKIIALLDDEQPLVQEISARIIGKMAKKHPKEMAEAIPKLIQLLEDGGPLTAIVGDTIRAMEKTFESFPEIVKPHIGTLIRLLNDNGEDLSSSFDLHDLHGRLMAGTERRMRCLRAPHWRGSAAFILGKIGAVEALVPLSQLLDDDRTFLFDNKSVSVAEVAREAYKKIEKIKIEQENIDRAKVELIAMINEALEEKR